MVYIITMFCFFFSFEQYSTFPFITHDKFIRQETKKFCGWIIIVANLLRFFYFFLHMEMMIAEWEHILWLFGSYDEVTRLSPGQMGCDGEILSIIIIRDMKLPLFLRNAPGGAGLPILMVFTWPT